MRRVLICFALAAALASCSDAPAPSGPAAAPGTPTGTAAPASTPPAAAPASEEAPAQRHKVVYWQLSKG